jgi:hypothetical protein
MSRDPLDRLHAQGGNCPAAVPIRGAADAYSGCICGVMLNDSRRADSILEGLIEGVYIAAWADPSTLVSFCFGDGLPKLYPEAGPPFDHYTACPIWAAEAEVKEVMDRVGGLFESELDETWFDLVKMADAGELSPAETAEALGLPGELDLSELDEGGTDRDVAALLGPEAVG